jgi:hypothetical protein
VVRIDDLLSNTKFHKPSRNEGIIPEKPAWVKIYREGSALDEVVLDGSRRLE